MWLVVCVMRCFVGRFVFCFGDYFVLRWFCVLAIIIWCLGGLLRCVIV